MQKNIVRVLILLVSMVSAALCAEEMVEEYHSAGLDFIITEDAITCINVKGFRYRH